MRKKLLSAVLAATMVCGMVLTGCSGSGEGSTSSGGSESGGSGSTHLNYGAAIYGTSLDPSRSYDSWELVRYGIGECLVRFAEDLSWEPWIAESWEMADDNLTWTFKIKDGVKFSDGSDCNASAIVASIERLYKMAEERDVSERPEVTSYFTYSDIQADDGAGTVTIVTDEPTPDLPGCLAYPFYAIVSVEAEEAGTDMSTEPVCTGPYIPTSFDATTGCELKKNENYWDGTPGYDTISMQVIQDSTQRSMALQSGDLDVASYITYADMPTFANDPDNYEVHEIASARSAYLYMNFADGHETANDAVRQAIMLCTDNETMCDTVVGGTYKYGVGIVPDTLGYGNENLNDPYQFDVEKAKKVLDDAGIVDSDGNGIRELDGKDIDIDLQSYENRSMDVFAESIKTQCEDIGIGVTISLSDSNTVVTNQRSGNYDMACYNTLVANTGDPARFLAYWSSTADANTSGYKNEEYDEIYDKLTVEFDTEKRKEYVQQLQQILIDDVAVYNCGYYMSNTCNSTKCANVKQVLSDFYWITKDMKPAE